MNNRQQKLDAYSLWADWAKSAMSYWENTASAWQDMMTVATGKEKRKMEDVQFQSMQAWSEMWSRMLNPQAMQQIFRAGTFNELPLVGGKSLIDGCMHFQEWMKSVMSKASEGKDQTFSKSQQEAFQSWIDFHVHEVQPLLKMPQVGLTRFYQEKLNQFFDKFNLYHASVAEFQYLLLQPMEASLREMQEKVDLGAEGGEPSEFKNYYSQWIKTLEGHYMSLFRSAEWNEALSRLVEQASDFRMSRNEILTDMMQFLPVPTHKEMDEVYRELYTLKKMVKKLIKKNRQEESKTR